MVQPLTDYMLSLGYPNIQKAVNSGPNNTINPKILKLVLDHQEKEGWFDITLDELSLVNPGDRIRYTTNNNPPDPKDPQRTSHNDKNPFPFKHAPRNKFRTGGWVINIDYDNQYILYRPHVPGCCPQSIQFNYIDKLFYFPKDAQPPSRKPVQYPTPTTPTNYPVSIKNKNGHTTIIYYAVSESKRQKFMSTSKFEKAKKYGFELF